MKYRQGNILRESQLKKLRGVGLPCFVKYYNPDPDEEQGYGLAVVTGSEEGTYLLPASGAENDPMTFSAHYYFRGHDVNCESHGGNGDSLTIYEAIEEVSEPVQKALDRFHKKLGERDDTNEVSEVIELIANACSYGMNFRHDIKTNPRLWEAAKTLASELKMNPNVPLRLNLKKELTELGLRLVTDLGYSPGSSVDFMADSLEQSGQKAIASFLRHSVQAGRNTNPITTFVKWMDGNTDAREILFKMGIEWPVEAEVAELERELRQAKAEGEESWLIDQLEHQLQEAKKSS